MWQRVEDSPVSQTWVQISSPFLLRLCDFSEPWFPPLFNEVITYLIKFRVYLENKCKVPKCLSAVPWCSLHVFSGDGSSRSFSFNSPPPALTERSNGSEFEWERRKTIPGGRNRVSSDLRWERAWCLPVRWTDRSGWLFVLSKKDGVPNWMDH